MKKLQPYLYKLASETRLGEAAVKIINAQKVEQALLPIIRQEAANFPACDDSSCELCQEALTDFRPSNEQEFYIFEREDILWSVAEKLQKSFFHLHEKYGNQVLMAGKIIDLKGIPTKIFSPFEPRADI